MIIEIPKELLADYAALLETMFRKAYERGVADGATQIDAAFERHRELLEAIERRLAVRLEPPIPPPPGQVKDEPRQARTAPAVAWTAEEEAHGYDYLDEKITLAELEAKLPGRTATQIRPKLERLRAKRARARAAASIAGFGARHEASPAASATPAPQKSAPPSVLVPDGAEIPERVDADDPERKRVKAHLGAEDTPGSSSEAEARLAAGGRSRSGARGEEDEQTRASAVDSGGSPEHYIDDAETGKPLRVLDAEGSELGTLQPGESSAFVVPPPPLRLAAQPSPQSQIDSELNRAVRRAQDFRPLFTPDSKPRYEAPLAAGVSEPPIELPDSEKLKGSR